MKWRLLFLLLAVATALALVAPAARAAPAGVEGVKGRAAYASLSADENGIYTSVYVGFVEATFHEDAPTEVTRLVYVSVYQFDYNAWTPLVDLYGMAELPASAGQITGSLTKARVEASIPVFDWLTGQETTLDVALRWTGVGELERSRESIHEANDAFVLNAHVIQGFRLAEVTGTVAGFALSEGSMVSANMISVESLK